MNPIPITSADELRMDRHAFVEASAGTGKTYLIEKLFLRLLREDQASAESILVLTYTEKAAGELRERIRVSLEQAAPGDERCLRALENFDAVPIHTIHGFCSELLSEYGAELGIADSRLVSDTELISPVLRNIFRVDWPGRFGDSLPNVLEGGSYPTYDGRLQDSRWENNVIRATAQALVPEEQIFPVPLPGESLEEAVVRGGREAMALLQRDTVVRVREKMDAVKNASGVFTYQDMLDRVNEHLPEEGEGPFLSALQRRFRYAVIDEFQDTDPVQWQIFRKIFLRPGGGRICLVGDPKQAIYGFRGADLETYLESREAVASSGGNVYRLRRNYRSTPALLDALHPLFSSEYWFGGGPGAMDIPAVEPSAPEDRKIVCASDDSKRAALVICKLEVPRAGEARRSFFHFIAKEIRRIVDGNEIEIRERRTQAVRPLHWGDFAVLVRSGMEVDLLETILRREDVPFSYYKKPRLYESLEAFEISLVLSAAAQPANERRFASALLTSFFRYSFSEASRYADFDSRHWARRFFARISELAVHRDWPRFFRALLYESRLFQGEPGAEFERHAGAIRQIFEELEDFGAVVRSDLKGLIAQLRSLMRSSTISVDDTGLYRRETEEHRVQIMTMHASKGLEFPVVFAAGGLTQPAPFMNSALRYTVEGPDGRKKQVMHLNVSGENAPTAEFVKEVEAENKRLYYVAFTRAVLKLYLPVFDPVRSDPTRGPLQTFARSAIEANYALGTPVAHRLVIDAGGEVKGADAPSPRVEIIASERTSEAPGAVRFDPSRMEKPPPDLAGRMREIVSYSGIVKHAAARFEPEERGVQDPAPAAEEKPPVEADGLEAMRGKQFGIFLHAVLETVDFTEFQEPPPGLFPKNAELVDRLLVEHGYDPEICRDPVRSLLARILTSPISALDHKPLCDIPAGDRTAEMEFYMQAPEKISAPSHPEIHLDEKGTVWGFIDLVFRYAGKVYLLDWKSDFLADYDAPALEEAVRSGGYDVQAALYAEAVRRWVARSGGSESFGGALYLFVRGMTPLAPGRGVLLLEAPL